MDYLRLKPFPSIGNGAFALVTSELKGYSLHGLVFKQGGTAFTKAMITALNIRAGKKDLLPTAVTGTQLQRMNSYMGLPDTTNYLMHYFGDPTARTIRGQHLGDVDLSIYSDDPLEITGTIAGATAPTMEVIAIVGAPKLQMGIGFSDVEAASARALLYTLLQPANAVSRQAVDIGLGSQAGARLRSLNFHHTNLTSVEFRKRSDIRHDNLSDPENDAVQLDYARVPQSNLYVLDRIVDGNAGEAESTLMNDGKAWPFQVRITTSAGDTIPTYADVHTPLALI